MDSPHKNETNANKALADLIDHVMHGRNARAEHTRIIKKHPARKPDLTITAKGRSPVVMEAKWMDVPEHLVEEQARKHLRQRVRNQPHPIEAAIALRYPNRIATVDDIDEELKKTKDLKYCAVYPKGKRFPTTGWLTGSVCDLADLIHLVDVPETAFDKAAEDLENSIDEAVSVLGKESVYPLTDKIFNTLQLSEDPAAKKLPEEERLKLKNKQTRRFAGAIILCCRHG